MSAISKLQILNPYYATGERDSLERRIKVFLLPIYTIGEVYQLSRRPGHLLNRNQQRKPYAYAIASLIEVIKCGTIAYLGYNM